MLCGMKRIHLTEDKKSELESRHRDSSDGKERDRIKAVLLRSEGWTVPMISQALRLNQSTIIRHHNDYREGKLKLASGGSESHLSEEQGQALIEHLESHTYHYVYDIIAYVESTWSIRYSVPGMNHWLHRHAFSYKKPKGHPHKVDKEAQAQFIKEYRELKNSLPEEDSIYFIDSVHPSQATKLSYGWIRTGKTKKVGTTASRTRINLAGAIQLNKIAEAITCQYDTINADSIADLMKKIRAKQGKEGVIHMVLDRAGYHRSEKVEKEAEEQNIKLFFLPAYSPNLNPIERLWKVMNEQVRNNRFFKSAKDFHSEIDRFFDEILPEIGESLSSRINDNFQRL
jgi:transposase